MSTGHAGYCAIEAPRPKGKTGKLAQRAGLSGIPVGEDADPCPYALITGDGIGNWHLITRRERRRHILAVDGKQGRRLLDVARSLVSLRQCRAHGKRVR